MPPSFDRYINLVEAVELPQAFAQNGQQLYNLDKSLLAKSFDMAILAMVFKIIGPQIHHLV